MKKLILAALAAFVMPSALAQASLEEIAATPGKAGGVYYAYPTPDSTAWTAAPKGYKPFYISHYGRHGSRYLISDNDYAAPRDLLRRANEAGALTDLGREVLTRLDSVWLEGHGRGGELSPLGARQHQAIARRMYNAYPQVFDAEGRYSACSTVVMRCAHSMFNFVSQLREMNPQLVIPCESGQRNMYFLNYHSPESGFYSSERGPWYQSWRRFRAEQTQPDRLVRSIFADAEWVATWVDPVEFMWQMYWVAVDMQNMETQLDFFDLFTAEELYSLWQVFNFNFFACNSSYAAAEGQLTGNARNLVHDMVAKADRCIAEGGHGADFRFGHDGNIIPLTALMRLTNCYTDEMRPERLASVWSDFKISPMASNVQMVFFRNNKGDVLVKILLNETEIAVDMPTDTFPYYRWSELREYLMNL
ncbi:MAG: histidine-type phosphatase [Muribaculaceae bacterium]